MSFTIRNSGHVIRAALALALAIAPASAAAQLPITGGNFTSASSVGSSSAVNGLGAYGTSVPLELPAARRDMPVPVHIVSGRSGVGAAGVGWDIPLSFIRRDTTFVRRRPLGIAGAFPLGRPEVTLSLEGRVLDLTPNGAAWAARRDAPELEVRQQDASTWIAFDGRRRQRRR